MQWNSLSPDWWHVILLLWGAILLTVAHCHSPVSLCCKADDSVCPNYPQSIHVCPLILLAVECCWLSAWLPPSPTSLACLRPISRPSGLPTDWLDECPSPISCACQQNSTCMAVHCKSLYEKWHSFPPPPPPPSTPTPALLVSLLVYCHGDCCVVKLAQPPPTRLVSQQVKQNP